MSTTSAAMTAIATAKAKTAEGCDMALARRISQLLVLTFLLGGLYGCTVPAISITVTPNRGIKLLPNESVTLNVQGTVNSCSFGVVCDDLTGLLIEYDVTGPRELSYDIDYSLRSANTPGVARLTVTAAADAPANSFKVVLNPSVSSTPVPGQGTPVSGTGWDAAWITVIRPPSQASPTQSGRFSAMAAGGDLSLAVHADGQLWSAGDGRIIGLAREPFTGVDATLGPVPQPLNIETVTVGRRHALALDMDGNVWIWGRPSLDIAQPGPGRMLLEPMAIPALPPIRSVSAGDSFDLALSADGNVWSWGSNSRGQLGNGSDSSQSPGAGLVPPGQVSGLGDIEAVAAGGQHSLALASDGTVWSWGGNSYGQLGLGERGGARTSPVQIPGLGAIQAIAAGREHSLALGDDGRVWAWGPISGEDTVIFLPQPTVVDGLPPGIIAIAAGSSALHSLALAADGSVWAWGYNITGQLGDGSTIGRTEPQHVPGLSDIRAIAAGLNHSLAASECGQLWAWGRNSGGQLAQGYSGGVVTTPLIVPGTGQAGDCPRVTLQLARLGAGSGGIEANGAEPACASDNCLRYGYSALNFERNEDIAITALADTASAFGLWTLDCAGLANPGGLTLVADTQCAAVFNSTEPPLRLLSVRRPVNAAGTISSSGGGQLGPDSIGCGPTCDAIFAEDLLVTLSAAPAADQIFSHWSDDCIGNTANTAVLMDANKFCTANFTLRYRMSVSTSGQGIVSSDPAGIDCGATCSYLPNFATVQLLATPAPGWAFSHWSADCTGTDRTVSVSMDNDRNCTAAFVEIIQGARLFVLPQGPGSTSLDPPGTDCGTGCFEYPNNTEVTVTATPDAGFLIESWSGCDSIAGDRCTVTLDVLRTVEVRFAPPVYTLTTTTILPSSVSSVPGNIFCGASCADSFDSGELVTLSANAATGWRFDRWTGDCNGTSSTVSVLMDRDKTCRASFIQDGMFTLTVVRTSSIINGTIVGVQPPGNPIDCGTQCRAQFPQGTLVVLSPDAASIPIFNRWSGCADTGGNSGERCFISVNSDVTVIAEFD